MIGVCFLCQKEKELHYRFKNNLICRACYKSKVNLKECCICHRVKPVQAKRDGNPICGACYRREVLIEECSICHNLRTVNLRIDGKAICDICYKFLRPLEKCSICHKEKTVAMRIDGKPVREVCYHLEIRKEECCICRRVKPISARREGMAVCSACHKRNQSKKNVFVRTFSELSDADAALLLTKEMRQGRKIFARRVGFLLKSSDETKNKLIEVLKIMLQIPSGWKIIEKIISGRNCVKFKEFLQSLY